MKAQKMEVASWKTIEPPTPQQQDARSCGVYVIKVGNALPALRYFACPGGVK